MQPTGDAAEQGGCTSLYITRHNGHSGGQPIDVLANQSGANCVLDTHARTHTRKHTLS